MRISILPYSSSWKEGFERERKRLLNALGPSEVFIEHIGSTAVEGLGAKPIIDIMVGFQTLKLADNAIAVMQDLGYIYVPAFEDVMPDRRYFTKSVEGVRTHHVHMVVTGTEFWNRHRAFRDHLRRHAQDREQYYLLKVELAKKEWRSGSEYAYAKTEFIKGIEQKVKASNKPAH